MEWLSPALLALSIFTVIAGGLMLVGFVTAVGLSGGVKERFELYASTPNTIRRDEVKRPNIRVARMRMRMNQMLSAFTSEELNLQLMSANWPITETEFVLIRFWGTAVGFLLGWLALGSPISGIGLAVIAFIIPALHLKRSINRRRLLFGRQLIDVLVLLTGAVRAGYSLQQSLEFVVKEMTAPASEEFKRVQYEVSLGLPLSQALNNLINRMQNDDLALLVSAININAQVGGNLVTMMNSVTETIRERIRLFSEVRALTSQQRFSSYILTLIPFAFTALLFIVNPQFIQRLFTPGIWLCFPIGALLSTILGNIVIRRITQIEV
jgi:tight adherence protein B